MGEEDHQYWKAVGVMATANMGTGLANVLLKKALEGGIDPMVIGTYRIGVSSLFLSPFALFFERKRRPKLTFSILCQHFLSALLVASLAQSFYLLGLTSTSATVTCAFFGMLPAITFALALIFRKENLNAKSKQGMAKVAGTLICIAGAFLMTFYKGPSISNPHSQPEDLHHGGHSTSPTKNKTQKWLLGCLFLLLADLSMSSWMFFQQKISLKYPCTYSSTVLMSVFGTFQCALLTLIKTRHLKGWVLRDKSDIIAVVAAGVLGQGISTLATTWCIKKRGPVFASAFYPITLASATLLDFIILRRQLYLSSIIGSVAIVMGLYVFLWGKHEDSKVVSRGSEIKVPIYTSEIPSQMEMETQNKNDLRNSSN